MEAVFSENICDIVYKNKLRATIIPLFEEAVKQCKINYENDEPCEIVKWTVSIFTNMRLFHMLREFNRTNARNRNNNAQKKFEKCAHF